MSIQSIQDNFISVQESYWRYCNVLGRYDIIKRKKRSNNAEEATMREEKKDPRNYREYVSEGYYDFLKKVADSLNLEYTGKTTEDSFPIFRNVLTGIEFEVIEETECFRLEMINL